MNTVKNFLYSRRNLGIKLGLERTFALMDACGEPGREYPIVQIVGTNGKGSSAAFLNSILSKAGYRVGMSTSPHLSRVNERIRINGVPVGDADIETFIHLFRENIERIGASFFEIITVMSIWYFSQNKVDIAVMETGLGGRLDSVSAMQPELTLMTSISKDHTEILGDTLEKIAFEKAGAFKKDVPCISVPQDEAVFAVLKTEARKKHTPLEILDVELPPQCRLGLSGRHQIKNAALAVRAVSRLRAFKVNEAQIRKGLAECRWPGRNQVIGVDPLIIFDVGHNADGIRAFLAGFNTRGIPGNKTLILALEARKDISEIIPDISDSFNQIICTETKSHAHMPAALLGKFFAAFQGVQIVADATDAIKRGMALTGPNDALAIVGTHYIGGAVHKYFKTSFDEL